MTIEWYFAYGSNMNPARMQARGISFDEALSGHLSGYKLCFNKRATGKENVAYANVGYCRDSRVEGVVYRLSQADDIALMDPFEGTPYRYSREVYTITTEHGPINAWVYIANKAMIAEGLLPEQLYLNHLLAGKDWYSESYHQWLSEHPAINNTHVQGSSSLDGLTHNI